jgi:hypothetical protein
MWELTTAIMGFCIWHQGKKKEKEKKKGETTT